MHWVQTLMVRCFFYKTLFVLLLGFTVVNYVNTAYAHSVHEVDKYPEIHFSLLKKALIAHEVVLIDANNAESYKKGHIPGALSWTTPDLDKKLPALKSYPVVVYCGGGACLSWMKVAKLLASKGYTNIMSYRAGLKGWKASGGKLIAVPVY